MFLNIKFISWIDLQDNMAADVWNFYKFYFGIFLFTLYLLWLKMLGTTYIFSVKVGMLILGTRSDDFVVKQN